MFRRLLLSSPTAAAGVPAPIAPAFAAPAQLPNVSYDLGQELHQDMSAAPLTTDKILAGWALRQKLKFDDGGVFDQVSAAAKR